MRSIGRKGTVRAMHILKIAGITLAIIIVLFVLSLFELWTQLARYQSYWTRQNKSAEGDITYVALGDSTAQAIGASHPSKGYVGIISKQLAEERGTTVKTINLSKSGAKIKDALNTQLPAMEKLGVTDQTVVTIEIGANDIISFDPIEFELQMDELMERLCTSSLKSTTERSCHYMMQLRITVVLLHWRQIIFIHLISHTARTGRHYIWTGSNDRASYIPYKSPCQAAQTSQK